MDLTICWMKALARARIRTTVPWRSADSSNRLRSAGAPGSLTRPKELKSCLPIK
jgi:hypothetical protein